MRNPFDLEPEEEQLIGQYAQEEWGSDFVFVTHYPSKKRPFYAMDDPAAVSYTHLDVYKRQVYTTNTTAMIVSISTIFARNGIGCPILAAHAIVCLVAIALITNGKVNAA